MFKVECPGCNAPYQVDERRVPSSGLKMRCPKCGTSFMVEAPADPRRTGPSPVLGTPAPKADSAKKRAAKGTMLGVAPSAGGAQPPGPGGPARPPPPRPGGPGRPPPVPKRAAEPDPYGELDLPTVGHKQPIAPPPAAKPIAPPMPAGPADDPAGADLPAPARPKPDAPGGFGEVDLPSGGPGGIELDFADAGLGAGDAADLPAPADGLAATPDGLDLPSPARDGRELDLPSPGRAPAVSDNELDLPSPGRGPRSGGWPAGAGRPGGEPDLPSPLPARGAGPGLPSPGRSPGDELELPSPGRSPGDELELPSPGGALDLPSPAGDFDLPSPGIDLDLPSPGAGTDLPSPGAGLPAAAAGLPAAAAGLPSPGAGLPAPSAGLPEPAAGLPEQAAGLPDQAAGLPDQAAGLPAGDAFGELELPLVGSSAPPRASDQPEAPVPPAPDAAGGLVRQAGGGTGFGEVNLAGAEEADLPIESATADGAPPAPAAEAGVDGPPPPAPAGPIAVGPMSQQTGRRAPREEAAPPKAQRGLRLTVAIIVLVAISGAALALVPELGPFGAYWIMDQVRADEYQAMVDGKVAEARKLMAKDTQPAAEQALATVEQARAEAKRVKALAAYAAFLGYARELRFGPEPQVHARAKVLLDELAENKGVRYLELAQAARAAATGQLARARQIAKGLGNDIDALVVLGEVELRAREPKAALAAWQAATKLEQSARTEFGLARAQLAAGEIDAAKKAAQAAVDHHAGHVGARILLARIAWQEGSDEEAAKKLLESVVADAKKASPDELVQTHTLLGDIHLARSRITHAEEAYGAALKINPKAAGALRGLGDALHRAGRYSEALARYEAAVQADPDDLKSQVGVAKAQIALERLQDATAMLKKLREAHPKSMLVAYWYGQAREALGNRNDAEEEYRAAIEIGGKDPDTVMAYVALALLLNQQGKSDEAQQLLDQAKKQLPESPAINKALGELALTQGHYEAAIEQFKKALSLDPEDVGAKFRLGVARRRNRDFDEATALFDEVEKVDRDYPGLALERGLLFEASGRTEEALKAYESALAKAPNDPDLMLRVGCGKVAAGRTKQAASLLRKVLGKRPNSAETNHCLGRALLLEGTNLAEALRFLERAVALDPHRAEYYLYVGWAANEAGRVNQAEHNLGKALELDQALADAYWQRGVLRYRQGAVKDAVKDLQKALELRPSRHDARAALADSYYDLGMEQEAMDEWSRAVQAEPDNATWRYRYGRLLGANRRSAEAQEQLSKAIELGEQQDPKPRWLWEAHHLLARAMGMRKEAAKHWEAFLRLGPRDSPYRQEAKSALAKLGRPWTGD